MKRVGRSTSGYTIVETLIFLAVTGTMFISAMLFLGGQQAKNEFSTGIRDVQSQITDILNDTSTGFYGATSNFRCTWSNGDAEPTIDETSPDELGASADCIFAGKALQFAPGGKDDEIAIHTLIGRRRVDGANVRTLSEANPKVLELAKNSLHLPYGLRVARVTYTDGAAVNQGIGSLAIASVFGGNAGAGGITGTQDVNLVAYVGTALSQDESAAIGNINDAVANNTMELNPDGGIEICINSGGTKQHGIIRIGGSSRQASAELSIESGEC